jgi:hypothetical protein
MDLENLIGSYAFPIIMCLWFMFRTEKFIQANTDATNALHLTLEKMFFRENKESEK